MAKRSAYRRLRHHPVVERVTTALRPRNFLDLAEVGMQVKAGKDDIVIDCGANVGDITSRFARTGAIVHAFEPNPICRAIIEQRFGLFRNVVIHGQGVMDKDCVLTLSTPRPHSSFDSIDVTVAGSLIKQSGDLEYDLVKVECIDLATFVIGLGKRVKLLKLDIEGSEIEVMNHLIDTGAMDLIDYAVVETHERFSPELAASTGRLRRRVIAEGLGIKVNFDWV